MTAEVMVMPGTRMITARSLTVTQQTRQLMALARAQGVTAYLTELAFQVCTSPDLQDDVRWALFKRLRAAVADLDRTDKDDGSYEEKEEHAGGLVCDLIHGPYTCSDMETGA